MQATGQAPQKIEFRFREIEGVMIADDPDRWANFVMRLRTPI